MIRSRFLDGGRAGLSTGGEGSKERRVGSGSYPYGMSFLPDPAAELSARQHAVLARWQLRRWLALKSIDGHVRRGNLQRLVYGIYRLPGSNRPEQWPMAAALRARPDAVLTGPFVLAHLRIDHFEPDAPFEVLTAPGRELRETGFRHRPDPVVSRSVMQVGDVRLATPVDALLESALWRPELPDRALRVAKDQLGWKGLVSAEKLRRRINERGEADPAVEAFLAAMDGDDLRCESEGERGLGPYLLRLDPTPEPQVWVTPTRRVDWYLRLLRLAWEYLGRVDHRGVSRRHADAQRDTELTAAGIRVLYVTCDDLRDPAALQATIMGAVAVRADELGVPTPRLRPA